MANKKYVNNEKDGWNQECEEDLLNLLDELNTKKIKSDEVCKIISIKNSIMYYFLETIHYLLYASILSIVKP